MVAGDFHVDCVKKNFPVRINWSSTCSGAQHWLLPVHSPPLFYLLAHSLVCIFVCLYENIWWHATVTDVLLNVSLVFVCQYLYGLLAVLGTLIPKLQNTNFNLWRFSFICSCIIKTVLTQIWECGLHRRGNQAKGTVLSYTVSRKSLQCFRTLYFLNLEMLEKTLEWRLIWKASVD